MKPLTSKKETIYVVPGTDAEAYVARRFPNKTVKAVGNSIRPSSIRGFLDGLPIVFQREQSAGLGAVYHFTFTGKENVEATVVIRDKRIEVRPGHDGDPDLRVTADSETWLGFLAHDRSLVWALLRRKIRLKGPPRLLVAFGKCFPS